jgi:hypothetical protein
MSKRNPDLRTSPGRADVRIHVSSMKTRNCNKVKEEWMEVPYVPSLNLSGC